MIPVNSNEKIFQIIKHLPKLETCTSFNKSVEVEVTAGLQFDHKENFECSPQLLKQTCGKLFIQNILFRKLVIAVIWIINL